MSDSEYLTSQIGARLRSYRKDAGLKLGELADRSGISIAMLSKIENGRVFPTLQSLIQILRTLKVRLNDFFREFNALGDFPGYIFRKKANYKLQIKEEGSVGFHYEQILNQTLDKSSMQVSMLTLEPGATRQKVSTSGFEYIYLIQGKVKYELGTNEFDMDVGDSLFFDGNIPHVPHNGSGTIAMLLVFYFINLD